MADKVKSKMDYKKMTTKELIHLISNQVDGEKVSEQNKLVIQDCCKALYDIKCAKYVKVSYQKYNYIGKRYKCPCDRSECQLPDNKHPIIKCGCRYESDIVSNRIKMQFMTSICKIDDEPGKRTFIPRISHIGFGVIKEFNDRGFYIEDFYGYDLNILKIEDIEC